MRLLNSLIESSSYSLYKILTTHCWHFKLGTISEVYTANNIVSGYTKCNDLILARKMFDEMSLRDTVSWNTLIAGFVNSGKFETSWTILRTMRKLGFSPDGYTFGSTLKGVASSVRLDIGHQLHSIICKMGYEGNVYAGSALLDMYVKCKSIDDAYRVFRCIPERNSITWNALISGFAEMDDRETAFSLLDCMEKDGVGVDDGTFTAVLTLLDDVEFYKLTMQIHGKILKHGLEFYNTVCNAMITSYSECGSIEDAKRVFDGAVGARDLVSWNSMLAAYLEHDKQELAFKLFLDLKAVGIEPDIYTYTSITSACFEEAHKNHGRSLHGLVIKRGLERSVPISNALVAMYLKSNNKSMEEALIVFNSMESKDRVSWNSILTGLSHFRFSEDALKFFDHMRSNLVEIDHYAFSAVLRSCSDLATLQLGQQVHVLALKSGFESNDFVASSLIFMYSKCGIIEDARKSFEETSQISSITWNSIIFGYAQHGQGKVALELFYLMREQKVKLDHITFVAVLTACSHIGLVGQGRNFLKCMQSEYGIPPRMEHYACAVDLFGRAGYLHEAKALVESMPFEPDAMVLKTFLGACRACGDIELASQVASRLLEIDPEEHCTYVLLSDMYGHLKRWNEKANVTRLMRERGLKKVPGWSWLEVKNEVHVFNAADRSHPHCGSIYQILGELADEMKWLDSDGKSSTVAWNLYWKFLWLPRPPSFLSPEKEEEIAKNLKKYSEKYEAKDQDVPMLLSEKRKKLKDEWEKWVSEWKRLSEEEKLERWGSRDGKANDKEEEEYEAKEVEVGELLDVREDVLPFEQE